MKLPHPQLEFVELLAEVPDSTLMVRSRKRERARALARLRREEKQVELHELKEIERSDSFAKLGEAQCIEGDYVASIESYERAMEIYPARTFFKLHVAVGYLYLNEFETAKDLLIDVLRKYPDEAAPYVALSDYYVRADPNEDMVTKLLARAIEIDPSSGAANNHFGSLAVKEGRFEDALAHFNATLTVYPDYAYAHYIRVSIYLEQTRYNEASQAFDQMLEIADFSDPKDAELLEKLKLSFAMESRPVR